MRFCGLYGGMEGVAMAGSARWMVRSGGRLVSLAPACQLPSPLLLELLL